MSRYLARIATGPRMGKDLSADEARDGIELVLTGEVDAAQAAVFLIALRMKLETHDELRGILRGLRAHTRVAEAEVTDLADLADPYNGYVRHLPATPFLPAVLAAAGLPAVLYGRMAQGPKWGLTAHRVLAACGLGAPASPEEAARRVADPDRGWAYLDLEAFCPHLADLDALRAQIVKRPCLSLLEKLLAPVRARRTHLIVGYTHRGYEEILDALCREGIYASMLAPRGVEGGVIPSVAARRVGARSAPGQRGPSPLAEHAFDPAAAGVQAAERAEPLPSSSSELPSEEMLDAWAAAARDAGRAALRGQENVMRRALVFAAASILHHVGREPGIEGAAARAAAAIDTGAALAHFERGLT
jgi:anthranilate phosphoribosyltransferase